MYIAVTQRMLLSDIQPEKKHSFSKSSPKTQVLGDTCEPELQTTNNIQLVLFDEDTVSLVISMDHVVEKFGAKI